MTLKERLIAEFFGTAGLLIVVVGSGIMGESLARENLAIALLANSLATGAGLYALIQTFGPVSGAHLNPAVTMVEWFWKRISAKGAALYAASQILGAIAGVWVTHIMFNQKVFQLSNHHRGDLRFYFSEIIATAGLITVISLSGRKDVKNTPMAVALYITAAYWCTSSTSFANPAVTIARSLTDTFSGILWTGVPGFVLAQVVGSILAYGVSKILSGERES